jgi:2-polyprenyl-3-methyl-5-hydroxy-6-metoxy-1,4-benzoquinol methylase
MITMETMSAAERGQALAERIFAATIGVFDLAGIYLGDRLEYYRQLVELGDATAAELAAAAGTNLRYTREWLEQQAVTGMLDVTNSGDAEKRRYSLPPGHDIALTDRDSIAYIAPVARKSLGFGSILPRIVEAYRTGDGVPYEAYGDDVREGIAEGNRAAFLHELAQTWIPAMPDIHNRLRDATRPARVADIGCGSGWSSIAIARGYPAVRVDGIDLDEASIAAARRNAAEAGVGDRVSFQARDAGDPALAGLFDLACAFECIHDMANPVATLRAMRNLVGRGGTVLIGDERVADTFTAPRDPIERSMYGASIVHCLPVGMVDQPSAATGTVMRADTFRAYAAEAGIQHVGVLPIDNEFLRFYRLTA